MAARAVSVARLRQEAIHIRLDAVHAGRVTNLRATRQWWEAQLYRLDPRIIGYPYRQQLQSEPRGT